MRRILGMIAGLMMGLGSSALAQNGPVVVELFTSQGCSSCPPADAYFLEKLAGRDDVVALALHVDYWDYIGWKDEFASPRYTKRQKAYARAAGHRTVYTPQMIIAGQDHVIGAHPNEVAKSIKKHASTPSPVSLNLTRKGQTVTISATTARPVGEAVVQLVRYRPLETVAIERGENAGRTVDYANIVASWERLTVWNGRGSITVNAKAKGDLPVVAIIQKKGFGPVLATARLK